MTKLHEVKAGEYNVVHYDHNDFDIKKFEERYKCKYVGEFTLKNRNGWANKPVSVFWQEEIPAAYKDVGSHYIGLYYDEDGRPMITDARTAVAHDWNGVLDPVLGTILYSAYRHDYQVYDRLMADGGPEYLRSSAHPSVKITIVKDSLKVERNNT